MTRCPSQDWDRYCAAHEGPDVTYLRVKPTRARKQHACYMCKDPIEPGTLYERIVYVDHDEGNKLVSIASHKPVCPAEVRDLEEQMRLDGIAFFGWPAKEQANA